LGGIGNDTLVGGDGDDIYEVESTGDLVQELEAGGVDTVNTALATYTLTANVENLNLTNATVASNGTGNEQNNVINGSALANVIYGGNSASPLSGSGDDILNGAAGNDTLYGLDGNDVLNGGTGNDSLVGGIGNDLYAVDSATDVILETNPLDTLTGNEIFGGNDTVVATVSYTLSANVEDLILQENAAAITGTGNTVANIITGNGNANTLNGGAGDDLLLGGLGADTLNGGADSDTLDGQQGIDSMAGGTGDDYYHVDNGAELVTELAGEGYETVYSTASYTLGSNVEELWLQGGSAIVGTGNGLDNGLAGSDISNNLFGAAGNDVIIGFGGNDSLDGGTGNDSLTGSDGNDTLNGGAGNDQYAFSLGDGQDVLIDSDATAGNLDVLNFSAVTVDQLWFRQVNTNDLEIDILGTQDKVTIQGWYLGNQNHVETIQSLDSSMALSHNNVNNLVTAMASFTTPPATMPTSLTATIAANWVVV